MIVQLLAARPQVQHGLRTLVEAGDVAELTAAVEEILRIDDPFVSNRRVTTQTAELGDALLASDGSVLLKWTAAIPGSSATLIDTIPPAMQPRTCSSGSDRTFAPAER